MALVYHKLVFIRRFLALPVYRHFVLFHRQKFREHLSQNDRENIEKNMVTFQRLISRVRANSLDTAIKHLVLTSQMRKDLHQPTKLKRSGILTRN